MTDHRDDELLGRILRDEAEAVQPSPDWDDVRERAQRGRRWWIPTAAAAVVVLVLLAAAVFALGGDDDDRGVIADDPSATTEPETSTTESPTTETTMPPASTSTTLGTRMEAGPEVEPLDLPAGEPLGDDEIVASIVVPNGGDPDAVEVVVLSKSSGDVLRTLVDGFDISEGGVTELTLTPDRRTVLYSVSTAACAARFEAAAVDGSGAPVPVADNGNQAAVSPDGTHLAIGSGDLCMGGAQIDLVPLAGGQSTRYTGLGTEDDGIESVAFADDDTLVYATAELTTEPALRLRTLDLGSGTATDLTPGPAHTNYSSLHRQGGTVTALEQPARGDLSLVTLEDGSVTDRRAVQITADLSGGRVGYDISGAVIAARSGDYQLSIDGRVIRDDVIDVGF